ncbi:hypothetical protein [Pararhizobium sp.]|uniref:hypothetical protein n=1 Tax=Pararhizobium sp. TaxID=1977563 RepID=UPI0027184C04|nr:hypothetical protein [Pararhizobium sp.]MDO9417018.1 hypothetical protein [Pararhizobium sp.]
MDWLGYKKMIERQRDEALAQIQWMKDHNLTSRQKTAETPEWVDTTQSSIYQYERVIDLLEKQIALIDERHLTVTTEPEI